jgi:hypothetical protein
MRCDREEVRGLLTPFILLSFVLEGGDSVLTDEVIKAAQIREKLRPVTQEEFNAYWHEILHGGKPEIRIAAYGNSALGPSEAGSFVGTPFLNTSGKIGIVENWTRGQRGDEWEGEWRFLFAPLP